MMPHPERMVDKILSVEDGLRLFFEFNELICQLQRSNRDHGLKLEEYEKIKKLLGRDANLLELGIFSAMWNEHCSYKSSKIHLKNYLQKII